MWIIGFGVMVLLGFTGYQDFKFRAVYWWIFPLLLMGLSCLAIQTIGWNAVFRHSYQNLAFLLIQMLFLTVYFSLKNKALLNIFEGYLGLGDLLFLLCISVYFSFGNYIVFYILSLLVVILFSLAARQVFKVTEQKIPLAGYQAILLFILLLADQFSPAFSLVSDEWLISYIGA